MEAKKTLLYLVGFKNIENMSCLRLKMQAIILSGERGVNSCEITNTEEIDSLGAGSVGSIVAAGWFRRQCQ